MRLCVRSPSAAWAGVCSLSLWFAACHEGRPHHRAEPEPSDAAEQLDADVADADEVEPEPADAEVAPDAHDLDAAHRPDASPFDAALSSECADPAHCTWLSLAVLAGESCAVREDHTLWCWGKGRQLAEQIEVRSGVAQLSGGPGFARAGCLINGAGDLLCLDRDRFSAVGAARGFEQVAIANNVGCAVRTGGKVSCFGLSSGFPARAVDSAVQPGLEALVAQRVAVADLHACAIDDQQRLWCWDTTPAAAPPALDAGLPSDAGAEAGAPFDAAAPLDAAAADASAGAAGFALPPVSPRQIDATQSYQRVAISRRELCAIRASGELVCWQNVAGPRLSLAAPELTREPGRAFRELALSDQHGCALAVDGSLWCWGEGSFGQLGTGRSEDSSTALRVDSNHQWLEVAASITHTCARSTTHQIWCWGDNLNNALGTPTTGFVAAPRRLVADRSFNDLSLSSAGGCAISTSGELWCWGQDSVALPRGTQVVPTRVESASDWTSVIVTPSLSCGLRGAGTVYCWGSTLNNRLSFASDAGLVDTPVALFSGTSFQRLFSDGNTTCGLGAAGRLSCWGSNASGTFGDGLQGSANLVSVAPERSFRSLAFGQSGTFAVTSDGSLWSWRAPSPLTLIGTGYTEIHGSGPSHCGLRSDGAMYCFGSNASGQFGTGDASSANTPVAAKTNERFSALALTDGRSCGLTGQGALWCTGVLNNVVSKDSSTSWTLVPVQASWRWKKVAHHQSGMCGLNLEGGLFCWGDTSRRNLGSDERFLLRPVQVPLP